ncbi:Piwi domain-containing protein [Ceratocystis lukuohia]|uniref:Piwi domain-containing protein n=1 Tax=Ceratocystis lukuohia TaxID=2019550 RepID=A0ABR4MNK2_9PEZI
MNTTVSPRPSGARGNTRIDLPAEAYLDPSSSIVYPRRPGYNSVGAEINIEINQFRIMSFDKSKKIWQYDVSARFLGQREPRNIDILIAKAWKMPECMAALEKHGPKWLYDGRKLAWSSTKVNDLTFVVDLDSGRPKNKGENKIELKLRPTTVIDLSLISAYVLQKSDMNSGVLEGINFLDHLIRQYPSEINIAIRRNFYRPNAQLEPLAPYVNCAKGTYASVRLNHSAINGGIGLGINVDVANTAFWASNGTLIDLASAYLPTQIRLNTSIVAALKPVKGPNGIAMSQAFKALRRIQKIRFWCPHQKSEGLTCEHTIFGFAASPKYGTEGVTAKTYKFTYDGREVSVAEYLRARYGLTLKYPDWPLVETTKRGTYFPPELCVVSPMQRYPYKLDPDMTAKMIKCAVTRPDVRKKAILQGRDALRWGQDPYMKHFGLNIDNGFTKTKAKLLKNPVLSYGTGPINPKVSGRWDLRNVKFIKPNTRPLRVWGVFCDDGRDRPGAEQFARTFRQVFTNHGGIVASNAVIRARQGEGCFKAFYDSLRQQSGAHPDIIFIIVRGKGSSLYERYKKTGDCALGVITQVVQSSHVAKNQPQYHSNVSMKVNAKLGGISCYVPDGPNTSKSSKGPTIIIGADVSHAPVGMAVPSMASMTMSYDRHCTRYGAAVETNGFRKEIVTRDNIHDLLSRLYQHLSLPQPLKHVYYLRDGVSEGQFQHVIDEEVAQMKQFFRKQGLDPLFTVIIATKRHHIRFFPERGDRNNNPLPGTLVERDITHPSQFDFYLCSHVAIQGTARPVHYHVIMDEAKCSPNDLQQMLYSQCYQYIRSTTPVSLHPAVYYAHLASNRARSHEKTSEMRIGDMASELQHELIMHGGKGEDTTAQKLETLGCKAENTFFRSTMWYI